MEESHASGHGTAREAIQKVSSDVARDPRGTYHFHTGPDYGAERLGCSPSSASSRISVTAPFAGVGNPLSLGAASLGDIVIDIDAGSGMDTFLAARSVGTAGRVIKST